MCYLSDGMFLIDIVINTVYESDLNYSDNYLYYILLMYRQQKIYVR